eukprot:3198752-Rhodomonas_salina.1
MRRRGAGLGMQCAVLRVREVQYCHRDHDRAVVCRMWYCTWDLGLSIQLSWYERVGGTERVVRVTTCGTGKGVWVPTCGTDIGLGYQEGTTMSMRGSNVEGNRALQAG